MALFDDFKRQIDRFFEPQPIEKGIRIRDVVRELPQGVGEFIRTARTTPVPGGKQIGEIGETAPFQLVAPSRQTRLERIQEERGQTLTPQEAKRVLQEEEKSFGLFDPGIGVKEDEPLESFLARKPLDPLAFAGTAGQQPVRRALEKTTRDPLSKLVNSIRNLKRLQKPLAQARAEERAARGARVQEIFKQEGGEAGFERALGALKGKLVDEPPVRIQGIDQLDVDDLFSQIQINSRIDVWDKITASNGLNKLLSGKMPQPSELSVMEDVFGSQLIKEINSKRGLIQKAQDVLSEIVNVPRAMITSFDMSAPLRQGVLFTTTKPKVAAKAGREMFRQAFSPKNFKGWLDDLPNHPYYREMQDSGLYIANPNRLAGGLSAREEKFMTNMVERIPVWGKVIKASERAYVGFLNKMRVDVFSQMRNQLARDGVLTPENLRATANFVNTATGRGSLGKLDRAAQTLNSVFFSPRLLAARANMLNPAWYAKQPAPVRKEAVKTFAQFIGTGVTVLGLTKLAMGDRASVELDPRSSDFGKLRVGNTRWDPWGGFQQWVRVFAQMATKKRKTTSGELVDIDPRKFPFESRLDVGLRFFRGKLAPTPSLVTDLIDGQDIFGREIELPKEVYENIVPLYLQDINEAIEDMGPGGAFSTGIPAFFGIGVQTFDSGKKSKGVNPSDL